MKCYRVAGMALKDLWEQVLSLPAWNVWKPTRRSSKTIYLTATLYTQSKLEKFSNTMKGLDGDAVLIHHYTDGSAWRCIGLVNTKSWETRWPTITSQLQKNERELCTISSIAFPERIYFTILRYYMVVKWRISWSGCQHAVNKSSQRRLTIWIHHYNHDYCMPRHTAAAVDSKLDKY